jgi:small ligand-binding sensory domain FIST
VHRYGTGIAVEADLMLAVAVATDAALEPLAGAVPDLLVVFVSAHYGPDAARAGSLAEQRSGCRSLIGGVGVSGVLGSGREVQDRPGVVVLAASLPGVAFDVHHLQEPRLPPSAAGRTVVLLADPYTFEADELARDVAAGTGGVQIVGGLVGGAGPGEARLLHDGAVRTEGAVALVVDTAVCRPLVSQGCRPIGPELVITDAHRNLVVELAGKPALERLHEVFARLDDPDRRLASAGLLAGLVVNTNQPDYEIGDFLVRVILGADDETGAIAIGDVPRVGQTMRFHVRDEASAHDELAAGLARAATTAPGAALVFSCNGRGPHLFSTPDHDAALVDTVLGVPAAGLFCQGELGPIGQRNALHGFTATIALFA